MIRSGSILVTGETVFGRCLSGHLFKGGTEAALTAETGLEADVLDGDLRKVQKIFCIVYPCQDHVFMRRESSLFFEKTTEIKRT